MAKSDCQNDELILSIAEKVGRQAYFVGVDLQTRFPWYSMEERAAFMVGWLTAEMDSGFNCTTEKITLNRDMLIIN